MILSAQVLALVHPARLTGHTVVHTTVDACRSLLRKAIRDGKAVRKPGKGDRWQVQYQMDCVAPFRRDLIAHKAIGKKHRKMYVEALYRCRHCEACMDSKARYWMARAADEYRRSARTFMGTFTLTPAEHSLLDVKVARSCSLSEMSKDQLFAARVREFGKLLDSYLDRLRAGAHWRADIRSGALRYLLVAERHDSAETDEWMRGRPHFHCLLHEQALGALVVGDPLECLREGQSGELESRKVFRNGQWTPGVFLKDSSMVRLPWKFGFTKFEWCYSEASAVYVCKYISGETGFRTRASVRYGKLGEPDSSTSEASEGECAISLGKSPSSPLRSESDQS